MRCAFAQRNGRNHHRCGFDDPETSKSYASGLEVGDGIYSINGRRTFTASDVSYMLTSAPDETVDMTVVRGGEEGYEGKLRDGRKGRNKVYCYGL